MNELSVDWKSIVTFVLSVKQEAEQAALARSNRAAAHEAAREAAAASAAADQIVKSPSDFSCHSYELFVGQEKGNDDNNKERMSIRSIESVSEHRIKPINNNHSNATNKVRKVSAVSIFLLRPYSTLPPLFRSHFYSGSTYRCRVLALTDAAKKTLTLNNDKKITHGTPPQSMRCRRCRHRYSLHIKIRQNKYSALRLLLSLEIVLCIYFECVFFVFQRKWKISLLVDF